MPTKSRPTPRMGLTVQVATERFNEVQALADSLNISRHKLLLAALEVGLPLAAAKLNYGATKAAGANPSAKG